VSDAEGPVGIVVLLHDTVVMTGTAPPRAGPGHVDAWLLKPFYVPALLNLIDSLLLSRAGSGATDAPRLEA
jgi:hypothetical protein